ncbi:60S ribosomal protein L22 [Dictyocoela muelleri]|nr:60S ribosomal protein L22 [Dictyocoela muelleri]
MSNIKIDKEPPKILANYTLDCSKCVQDSLFDANDLKEHLISKIKVNGKTGHLGKKIIVNSSADQVTIVSQKPLSKRYIKYLSKKFLYARKIKDWVRVVASDRNGYRFSYYNVDKDAED